MDERPSAQGVGAVGIAMFVIVFGGLVLLDATSLIAHIKTAANNLKELKEAKKDEEETDA